MLYLCKPDDVILPCKICKNIVFRLTSYNPSFLSVFKGLYFLFEDKSLENKIILFLSETVMVRGSFSIFKRLFPSNMFHFLFENASRVHLCTPVVTMFSSPSSQSCYFQIRVVNAFRQGVDSSQIQQAASNQNIQVVHYQNYYFWLQQQP